jgi:hypothetical protein
MRPFIKPGDDVRLAWDNALPPRAGEIVAFRTDGGEWVLHRVVGDRLGTKGDAAWCEDVAIPAAARSPWARVVAVRRAGASAKVFEFSAGRCDRWIAGLSRLEVSFGQRPSRRLIRDAVYALAALRRGFLAAWRPSR